MGMPITVEIVDSSADNKTIEEIFSYFSYIDEKFSTYKEESEISKINRGEISQSEWSDDMKTVFALSEKTKKETNGYFDIMTPGGNYDPSGLVKGWAIYKAAEILERRGIGNFYINAGGDIQVKGKNSSGKYWKVGIKNPFSPGEIIKIVELKNEAIATSGTYERGEHIYNPLSPDESINDIVSLSVVASDIYEADRFATAAFAMGRRGIDFIEKLPGLEGYMVDKNGLATMTSGFKKYVEQAD